jgi:hypothetical protein
VLHSENGVGDRATSGGLWGLLWGLWVQIGINRYLSISLSGIQKTAVAQGFGAY